MPWSPALPAEMHGKHYLRAFAIVREIRYLLPELSLLAGRRR